MGATRAAVPQAVMSIDQLAAYLQLPKSTLYKLVQEGKVPGRKLGRQWRFHRSAVDAWLTHSSSEGHGTETAR